MDNTQIALVIWSLGSLIGVFLTTKREMRRGRPRAANLHFVIGLLVYLFLALVLAKIWVPTGAPLVISLCILFALAIGGEYVMVRNQRAG